MVNFSNKIRAAEHMLLQAQLRPGGLPEVRQSCACCRMPYCHRSARASPASKFCMAWAEATMGLPPCCERGQRGCGPMGSFGEWGRRAWLAPAPRNQHSSTGMEILQRRCLSSPSPAGLVSGVPFLNRVVTAWFLLAPVSTSPSIQVRSWVPSPFLSFFA